MQVTGNLDLNADPPHCLAHALSTRTKAQEQKIMESLGYQKRQEGGKEGVRVLGFSPGRGDD